MKASEFMEMLSGGKITRDPSGSPILEKVDRQVCFSLYIQKVNEILERRNRLKAERRACKRDPERFGELEELNARVQEVTDEYRKLTARYDNLVW